MDKKCMCEGITRKGDWPIEVTFYPPMKKLIVTAVSVDMTGQSHTSTVEIPVKYCPECGRKL